jgi:hypothetical protein
VFLTAEQADVVAALLLRASTRPDHQEVAEHLDAGDIERLPLR